MINNRQSGRRRGRGGGPRTPNNSPSPGNRQDNRQRGNAAQLLEKYKSMARDAQMQGDRVQTEYYLQFADHYHRVLSESRSRFEEQRPRRDDYMDEDEDQDDLVSAESDDRDDGDDRDNRYEREERHGRSDRQEQGQRPDRGDRQERAQRQDRGDRQDRGERQVRNERPDRGDRQEAGERQEFVQRPERADQPELHNGERSDGRLRRPRGRRERFEGQEAEQSEAEERISLDSLPPAIAVVADNSDEVVAKAPRRRTRRPRDEGEAEIAPAA